MLGENDLGETQMQSPCPLVQRRIQQLWVGPEMDLQLGPSVVVMPPSPILAVGMREAG